MPSDLQVDNIKDGSATKTLATLSSSAVTLHSDVTFPTKSANTGNTSAGGHVLQVQQKVKRDEFSTSSTNNAFTAITGLDVKIPPSSASSKILVSYHINICQSSGSHTGVATALYKGGSIITNATGSSAGCSQNAVTTVALHENDGDNNAGSGVVSAEFLDSPGSTSELTYQVYLFNASGGGFTAYVNRPQNDTNNNYITKGASFITAMEIA